MPFSALQPNYPNPVTVIRERLIFVRFDKTDPSSLSTPVYFPNDDVLAGKVITGISVFKSVDPETPGYTDPILTDAGYIGTYNSNVVLRYFTLTLVGRNNEILINDLPLACLTDTNDFDKIRRFSLMADLSKSYVRNFGYIGLTTVSVIPINFYYKNISE
jgi:hypothetical protein